MESKVTETMYPIASDRSPNRNLDRSPNRNLNLNRDLNRSPNRSCSPDRNRDPNRSPSRNPDRSPDHSPNLSRNPDPNRSPNHRPWVSTNIPKVSCCPTAAGMPRIRPRRIPVPDRSVQVLDRTASALLGRCLPAADR